MNHRCHDYAQEYLDHGTRKAEASIQQINLTEIPKDLIVTKERLTRINSVRERLLQLEAASADKKERSYDEVISLLSLLNAFEKENVVTVGDVIRQSPDQGPIRAAKSTARAASRPRSWSGCRCSSPARIRRTARGSRLSAGPDRRRR